MTYAKIIDEKTKRCLVGLGDDAAYYESEGYIQAEVELGYDGWYIAGYVPDKPQSVIDAERIDELQKYLDETDWYVVRFAETGVAVPEDVKAERQAAREEISRLREDNADGQD